MRGFRVPDKGKKLWESDEKNSAHFRQLLIAMLLLDYNDERHIFSCQAHSHALFK